MHHEPFATHAGKHVGFTRPNINEPPAGNRSLQSGQPAYRGKVAGLVDCQVFDGDAQVVPSPGAYPPKPGGHLFSSGVGRIAAT